MLGDVLARLKDEGAAAEIILGVGDLRLLAAMRELAESEGLDLAAYARTAVQRYAAEASDEEWITLMGLINRAGDPGTACLKACLRKRNAHLKPTAEPSPEMWQTQWLKC